MNVIWVLWVVLVPLVLLLALVLAGILYEAAGEWVDRRRFPPPGKFVTVDGQRLHFVETPSNTHEAEVPTILLEAGISASSLTWRSLIPRLSDHARVIAYDRGGLAWSAAAGDARLADRMVFELNGLLETAHKQGPLILVGHSFGGLLCLMYAARHRNRVAGVVLVDPIPRCDWQPLRQGQAARLRHGVRLSLRGALLAKLGVVRFSLTLLVHGARLLPKAVGRFASGGANPAMERWIGQVKKMPPETWPAVRAHWSVPKTYFSMASHLKNLPESVSQYDPDEYPPYVPLTILSAESAAPSAVAEHHADAMRSLVGEHCVVAGSGHWIHLDQPEVVVDAILRLVRFVRTLDQPA